MTLVNRNIYLWLYVLLSMFTLNNLNVRSLAAVATVTFSTPGWKNEQENARK